MTRVLVIDDELSIQKLVKTNLGARGYQVAVAADGEKGLEAVRLDRPDLILLALMLPGMSGWDVLMALKTDPKLRKIPVIIMTAAAPEGEEYKVRSMRAAGYLVKPFGVDELMRQLEQVLSR